MLKFFTVLTFAVLTLGIFGCGGAQPSQAADGKEQAMAAFRRVSSDEAAKMMTEEKDYLILDVRTAAEYAGGHLPNAVNVPNESIGTTPPKELPDKAQKIFVYCRSGARSQQAAQKLAHMGYTNIVEMGGIQDWHGDIEK